MDIVKLHQKIDEWAAEERAKEQQAATTATPPTPATADVPAAPALAGGPVPSAEVPSTGPNEKNQRVVRTKTSGDRVYLVDETNKTRQWITTPQILEALGFTLNNVSEMEEPEFLKYNQGPAIYKLPDAPQA